VTHQFWLLVTVDGRSAVYDLTHLGVMPEPSFFSRIFPHLVTSTPPFTLYQPFADLLHAKPHLINFTERKRGHSLLTLIAGNPYKEATQEERDLHKLKHHQTNALQPASAMPPPDDLTSPPPDDLTSHALRDLVKLILEATGETPWNFVPLEDGFSPLLKCVEK
jgi:hypothetical protein